MNTAGGDPECKLDTTSTTTPSSMKSLNNQKLNLSTLPEDVLRCILDFLLTARYVKKLVKMETSTGSRYEPKTFSFQTAVMRVNKSIYKVALEVFMANQFIRLSTTEISKVHAGRDRPKGSRSRGYIYPKDEDLLMHIKFTITKPGSLDQRKWTTFILCLADLEHVVLHLARLAARHPTSRADYVLKLSSSVTGHVLSTKLKNKLLGPFQRVNGSPQSCTIHGVEDKGLAQEVVHAMAPRVSWFRARLRKWYGMMRNLKSAGDHAFDSGHLESALSLYEDACRAYAFRAETDIEMLCRHEDDTTLFDNICDLFIAVRCNLAIVLLLLAQNEPNESIKNALMKQYRDAFYGSMLDNSATTSEVHFSALTYCHVLHAVSVRKNKDAKIMLDRIATFEQFEGRYDRRYKHGISLAQAWVSTSNTGEVAALDKDSMAELFKLLPQKSIPARVTNSVCTSASIDLERYILRSLGYQGDLYEDSIIQKEGRCVKFDRNEYLEVVGPLNTALGDFVVSRMEMKLSRQEEAELVPQVELCPFFATRTREYIFRGCKKGTSTPL